MYVRPQWVKKYYFHPEDGKGRGGRVGVMNIGQQPDANYIYTEPDDHINPEDLEPFLFYYSDLDIKIGSHGEMWLRVPKSRKHGLILNKIAEAYYHLQKFGRLPHHPPPEQTQLNKESHQ